MPTVEHEMRERRKRAATSRGRPSPERIEATASMTNDSSTDDVSVSQVASPQNLKEETDGEAAFNPDTGEINWDCPCLGGMAHGPCGEAFKAAFSCFVYSEQEPKGMDCIEKFK